MSKPIFISINAKTLRNTVKFVGLGSLLSLVLGGCSVNPKSDPDSQGIEKIKKIPENLGKEAELEMKGSAPNMDGRATESETLSSGGGNCTDGNVLWQNRKDANGKPCK